MEIMTNYKKEFKTKGPKWKRTLKKEVKGRKKLDIRNMCYMPGFLISEKLSNLPKVTRLSIWKS